MTKDEIKEMRCDMHKGVKMFNQELEDIARGKKEFSWKEMMQMSDILKDMSEVEKNLLAYAASQRAIIDELFDTTHKSIANVLDAYEKKAQSMIRESRSAITEGSAGSDCKTAK